MLVPMAAAGASAASADAEVDMHTTLLAPVRGGDVYNAIFVGLTEPSMLAYANSCRIRGSGHRTQHIF